MAYTDEEVSGAVGKLVTGTISRPRDALGVRRPDLAFNDYQQAAASSFLLYPDGLFYLLSLGGSQLLSLARAAATSHDQILAYLQALGRLVLPVKDLTPLGNAKAALQELAASMLARSSSPKALTALPAYQRYQSNVDSFLSANGQNIKSNGDIVPPPAQVRAELPALISDFQAQVEELRRRAGLLAAGADDYTNLNLPTLVAQGVMGKAASILEGHYQNLSGMSEADRNTALRQVALDMLAAKGILKQIGTFQAPAPQRDLGGTATPFSDASHPALPAQIISVLPGPYAIPQDSSLLSFSIDSDAAPLQVQLQPSYTADILGSSLEPYNIPSGQNVLEVTQNGVVHSITLTAGTPARTAAQVADDMNAVLLPLLLLALPLFDAPKSQTSVVVAAGPHTFTSLIAGVDFVAAGVLIGDVVVFLDGLNRGKSFFLSSVTPTILTTVDIGLLDDPGATIQVSTAGTQRLTLKTIDPAAAASRVRVGFTAAPTNTAAAPLGFVAGMELDSKPTSTGDMVTNILQKTPRLTASKVFSFLSAIPSPGRTDPSNPGSLIASKIYGPATIAVVAGGYTVSGQAWAASGVVVGDVLVPRQGDAVGLIYTVTALNPDGSLHVTGPATAGGGPFPVDVGHNFGAVGANIEVQIDSGPNKGNYVITAQATVPFDWTMSPGMPVSRDDALQPVPVSFLRGSSSVAVASAATSTASALGVNAGAAATLVFGGPVPKVFGTTPWLQGTSDLGPVKANDVFDYYGADVATPSASYQVQRQDPNYLFRMAQPVPSNLVWHFSSSQTVPFGRVRGGLYASFAVFANRLVSWLGALGDEAGYFLELSRRINIVLVHLTPTPGELHDATSWLQGTTTSVGIGKTLTRAEAVSAGTDPTLTLEDILLTYVVKPVPVMDVLLKSLKQQGADRAYDLLIEGQFSTFFGLDVDSVSYAGNMLARVRDMMREDMPARKTGTDRLQARVVASTQSDDPEYIPDDAVDQGAGSPETFSSHGSENQ